MNQFLKRLGLVPAVEESINLDSASALTWSQVQNLLRSTYQRRGYSVESVPGQAPVDMVLQKGGEKVFLECRHWQVWEVPDKAVHELAGYASGAGADHAVMFTSGHFSSDACDYAAQRGVELVDGAHLKTFVTGTPSRS
jgi:restriction system protein